MSFEKARIKAEALGISESELTRALVLVRDLRKTALEQDIDGRALRIALLYANMVDYHFAQQKLALTVLRKLEEIALDLFAGVAARGKV